MDTQELNIKQEAQRLVAELPENATWEDLMYRIYVRQAVESGLQDSQQGNTKPVAEVRKMFGLQP
jgi:Fe-S cluster assembly iron-binding protein IscA